MQAPIITCPSCREPIAVDSRFCEYCHHEIPLPNGELSLEDRVRATLIAVSAMLLRGGALALVVFIAIWIGVAILNNWTRVGAATTSAPTSGGSVFDWTPTPSREITAAATSTPAPSNTAVPSTALAAPTAEPAPTHTPAPTNTSLPTETPPPTSTPAPTDTPTLTWTPIPEIFLQEGDSWRENGVSLFFDVTGFEANGLRYDLMLTNQTGQDLVGSVNSKNMRLRTNTGQVIDPKIDSVAGKLAVRGDFVLRDGETLVITQGGLLRFTEIANPEITHVDFEVFNLTPRIQRATWRVALPR
jgi:hypothetical protein